MQINKVRLRNIGPHQEFQVELGRGLIGVIGSNGAGKSTLINSIYAALTNDFSRFSSVKSDIIRNGSGTEPSFIQLEGTHRGQEFLLTRYLRPSKNEFRIGTREYTKANDVNDAVTAELNITKAVIDKYVFVDQWQMFGFLDETPSERAKTFQFLCGTEIAGKIHKVCSDYVTRQQGIEIVDNSIELQATIDSMTERMVANRALGKAAEARILDDATREQLQQLIRDDREAGLARTRRTSLKLDLEVRKAAQAQAEADVTQSESELTRREVWLRDNRTAIGQAQSRLDARAEYEAAVKARETRLQSIKRAQDELASRPAPVLPENYVGKPLRQPLRDRKHELTLAIKLAESTQLEDAVCHACQQTISPEHRQRLLDQLAADRQEHADLTAQLAASDKYDANLDCHQSWCADREEAIRTHQERLAGLATTLAAYGDGDLNDAEALIAKADKVEEQVKRRKKLHKELTEELAVAEREVEYITDQLEACRVAIRKAPKKTALDDARTRLDDSNQATRERSEALGAYREAKQALSQAETVLSQLKLRLAEKAKIRNLLDTISAVGDVFHWNALPKAVSQANLELLVGDINANLSLFNNPFVVEADSDLTFKVFMPGQQPVKARQLSGGQKVILAIAFRAALDRVFGHDVGMMFLDEPTSGLDADNVNFFHEALQQLAQKVGQDRQLVVITHVNELGSVFDQLVEVKKG